jgi:hypothetical protein
MGREMALWLGYGSLLWIEFVSFFYLFLWTLVVNENDYFSERTRANCVLS